MQNITIRPRSPDDDERIVDIINTIYTGVMPNSIERYRHGVSFDHRDERNHVERLIAEVEGELVGYLLIEKMWQAVRPGAFYASIKVDPAHWGRGIGSRLYDVLLERIRDLGGARIYSEIREDIPESDRFATARGFTRTGHGDRESRLDVTAADLEGYDGLEERLTREGLRITTMSAPEAQEDSFLRAVHDLESRAVLDIPSTEEFGNLWRYEDWREEMLNGPGRAPDAFFIAVDGNKPVGVARLRLYDPVNATNGFTGVDRAYRGKGVARALKARTINWARHHGVRYIYTGNDVENDRMLAINIRLGYQPVPSQLEIVKEL